MHFNSNTFLVNQNILKKVYKMIYSKKTVYKTAIQNQYYIILFTTFFGLKWEKSMEAGENHVK